MSHPLPRRQNSTYLLTGGHNKEVREQNHLISPTAVRGLVNGWGKCLTKVAEDDPVGGVIGEVAYDEDQEYCQDNPDGPVVLDEAAFVPAFGKVYGSYHFGHINYDVQEHDLVPYKDPVGKEGRDNYGHHCESSQDGPAYLTYVMPGYCQVDAQEQHRVEDHFHMGHHAFYDGENVSPEMVEEWRVVHEMHPGSKSNQDDGDDNCFSTRHILRRTNYSLKKEPGRGWQL